MARLEACPKHLTISYTPMQAKAEHMMGNTGVEEKITPGTKIKTVRNTPVIIRVNIVIPQSMLIYTAP
jgi:hypothetical protein